MKVKARYLLGLAAAALLALGCTWGDLRPAPVVGISPPAASPVSSAPRTTVGNGLWHVGTEAAAGRWVAYPPSDRCRWIVRTDDTPEGFVAGYDGTGWKADTAVYATVKDGQTFETALCGTWLKVG